MTDREVGLQVAEELMLATQTAYVQHHNNIVAEQASIIRALEQEVQGLRNANATLSAQVSAPTPQQHDYSRLFALEEELSRQQAEILEKEKQLQERDRCIDGLRDELGSEALEAMKRQPLADLIQGPGDSTITKLFVGLKYAIANFTSSELKGAPFSRPTKKHTDLFTKLNGDADDQNYKHYLTPKKDSPSRRKELIFQAMIWYSLNERLFRNPTVVFYDNLKDMQAIKMQAKRHSETAWEKYHNWRAYTADFLDAIFQDGSGRSSRGTSREDLVNDLFDLVSRYSCSAGADEKSLKRQLERVVDDAVALSSAMAKSRAWWMCCMTETPGSKQRFGFQMRKESMDFVTGLGGKLSDGKRGIVDLIAQPALLKYGTGRGKNHQEYRVVEKAGVVAYV